MLTKAYCLKCQKSWHVIHKVGMLPPKKCPTCDPVSYRKWSRRQYPKPKRSLPFD